MAYYCHDCSYRGKSIGQAGDCQACGSYNISRGGAREEEKAPPGKWRLLLLAALWLYLLGLIIWKLNS